MEDPNIITLEWIFDFLSVDLSNVDELRLEALEDQAEYYFINQWRTIPLRGASVSDETAKMYRRRGIGRTRSDLRWPSDYPWASALKSIQGLLTNELQWILDLSPESESWGVVQPSMIPHRVRNVGEVKLAFDISPDSFSVGYRIIDSPDEEALNDPDYLLNNAKRTFYLVLDRLPNGSIKKCAECGRFFLHLHKKPKMFCSQKCASRASARAHREKVAKKKGSKKG